MGGLNKNCVRVHTCACAMSEYVLQCIFVSAGVWLCHSRCRVVDAICQTFVCKPACKQPLHRNRLLTYYHWWYHHSLSLHVWLYWRMSGKLLPANDGKLACF